MLLRQAVSRFPVVLLTGPRQSGKTTFLKTMMLHHAEYITFDDPVTREFAEPDPKGFPDQFTGKPVIPDEVQYAPGLLPYKKMNADRASFKTIVLKEVQQIVVNSRIRCVSLFR
ncbi:MAG: AAA family ATPase [Spirochaetales bacterium]|nr:AAA family ATPase [Spirochaetales bacterium]